MAPDRGRGNYSLVAVVQCLEGQKVIVELRNDIVLRGLLENVDRYLNMIMSNVVYHTLQGPAKSFPLMYIKGRNVRYVHLPKNTDAQRAMDDKRNQQLQSQLQAAKELLASRVAAAPKGAGPAREVPALQPQPQLQQQDTAVRIGAAEDENEPEQPHQQQHLQQPQCSEAEAGLRAQLQHVPGLLALMDADADILQHAQAEDEPLLDLDEQFD